MLQMVIECPCCRLAGNNVFSNMEYFTGDLYSSHTVCFILSHNVCVVGPIICLVILKSRKIVPKHILKYVKHDVKSVTGSNLRNILLLTDRDTIEEISKHDVKGLKYHEVSNDNIWKIGFIKEIIEIKNNQASLNDFSKEELNDILANLCTS